MGEKPGLVRHQNCRRHVDGVLATSFELAGGVGSDWGFYWPVAGLADSRRCLNAQSILSFMFDMHFSDIKTVWLPPAGVRRLETCGGKIRAIGTPWAIEKLPWPRSHRFVNVQMPVNQATPLIGCSRPGIQCGDAAAPDAMATPGRQSLASAQPDFYPPDCGRWQRPSCQPSSPVDVHCMSTGLSCYWRAMPFRLDVSVRNMRNRGLDKTIQQLRRPHTFAMSSGLVCLPARRITDLPHVVAARALGRFAYI